MPKTTKTTQQFGPQPKKELKLLVRNPAQFGNALLRFRKKAGLTQDNLGERAGIKQSSVSMTEGGNKGTSLDTIFKILAALDLEIILRKRKGLEENLDG